MTGQITPPLATGNALSALGHRLQQCQWQSQLPHLRANVQSWLLNTASLTERLQAHTDAFNVQVIQQSALPLLTFEAQALGPNRYQVREVLLRAHNTPWVFARSVIPESLCRGEFVGLGNQPLGKILFNDPRFVRRHFTLCEVPAVSPFAQYWEAPQALHGRYSVFDVIHTDDAQVNAQDNVSVDTAEQVLVTEMFLPHSPLYQHDHPANAQAQHAQQQ